MCAEALMEKNCTNNVQWSFGCWVIELFVIEPMSHWVIWLLSPESVLTIDLLTIDLLTTN